MSHNAIVLHNVCTSVQKNFWQPRQKILKDMNLRVEIGTMVGFLGPNGAGKTTTIKAILDLIHIDSGTIEVFGKSMADGHVRSRVGFMPERPYFPEFLTGHELLHYHGQLAGMDPILLNTRISALLRETGLQDAGHTTLRHYSKGMLQRIGLAQALIGDPDVIILDEPLSDLDPVGRSDVRNIMRALKQRGKTILFSTHILHDVEEMCDRIAIVMDGHLHREESLSGFLQSCASSIDIAVQNLSLKCRHALTFLDVAIHDHPTHTIIACPSQAVCMQAVDILREFGTMIDRIENQHRNLEALLLHEIHSHTQRGAA